MNKLPDVQEDYSPKYKILIPKVGVENIKLPFNLALKNGDNINLVANTSIYTDLSQNKKGISMSRLLIAIEESLYEGLNWDIIKQDLIHISNSIGSDKSYLKFEFELPILKKSPLTKYEYPMFHKCCFVGYKDKNFYRFLQSVEVQYTSYCPCSAELSKDLMKRNISCGFPHAQRSFAKIIIDVDLINKHRIWLEDIIDIIINNIPTQPYPVIKRIDEQEIARIASNNPLFVEDAIRILSFNLNNLMEKGINDWIVKCVHEESIHAHEAVAINIAGIIDGFTVNDI